MNEDKRQFFRSRVIDALDNSIRTCHSLAERNVLFAKKAFTLARHSKIAEAKEIIRALRELNKTFETRLSAWIMFAEGIIEYSETLDIPKSKDRVLRGHLVGQVANDPSLAGTSAAWLAFFCFQQSRFVEAKDYLGMALSWTKESDTEARARAYMVVGMGFFYAGDRVKGKLWMHRARQPAVLSGDIAMQNIIFCNTAAYLVAQLVLIDCVSTVSAEDLSFASLSSQSAGNLNAALGIANQGTIIPLQRADIFTIEKRWAEAIDLFNKYIE